MTISNPRNNNKSNNFDLIRLFAACSVLLFHLAATRILPTDSSTHQIFYAFAQLFPGVPIFFIVSGFLITNSWLRNPHLWSYIKARFLRIYPALCLSTLITSAILFAMGYWNFTWFINQFTVIWLYSTPQITVPFGGGMPNGAMWSIPVECKFYILVPLLLYFVKSKRGLAIAALLIISALLYQYGDFGIHHKPDLRHGALHHFWFFGFGMFGRLYFDNLKPFLKGWGWWMAAHALITGLMYGLTDIQEFHIIGTLPDATWTTLAVAPTLLMLVLSTAFELPAKGHILKGNDISYGMYIYQTSYMHMLHIIGLGSLAETLCALTLTLATAWLSWTLVERPCLRLK